MLDHGISDLASTERGTRSLRAATNVRTVLVTEAPPNADLAGAQRWEEFHGQRRTDVRSAYAKRRGVHCLFFRHRRPPQGLHDDARKLSRTVRRAYFALSVFAGRPLPQHFADESRHRFHGGFLRAFHLRCDGRAFAHTCGRNMCAKRFRNTKSPTSASFRWS